MTATNGDHQYDVAIIGGGSAGLVTAHLLDGVHEVTVFEREERVLPDYRASTFHPATMDLFEGTGISEAQAIKPLRSRPWKSTTTSA